MRMPILNAAAESARHARPYRRVQETYQRARAELLVSGGTVYTVAPTPMEEQFLRYHRAVCNALIACLLGGMLMGLSIAMIWSRC